MKVTGKSRSKQLIEAQHANRQFIYPAKLAAFTELPFPAETPIPASVLIQDLPQTMGVDRWPHFWTLRLVLVGIHDPKDLPVTLARAMVNNYLSTSC